jgi:AcrR family transcriptional regulator
MRSDGEATRQRILDAARAEFAECGLAGARVDRIAASATASKERLYAYFGDKRALFEAVLELNRREVSSAIPLDVDDLPGFVGRVFDHMHGHPAHLRILTWARLEGVDGVRSGVVQGSASSDREAFVRAQAEGRIDGDWEPEDLVAMLFSIAAAWVAAPGIFVDGPATRSPAVIARRRASAVRAAQKLVRPATAARSDDPARS